MTKKKHTSSKPFPVVGIGASAGGLDAFKKLLQAIPKDSGMAYVLVQHLDPNHKSSLTEIMTRSANIPVLEITDKIKVEPNHIYIIPSNKELEARDDLLNLSVRPLKSETQDLPINHFFYSLAEVYQADAIGIILSGTGSDGTKGLEAIKDLGGITLAQDEETAEHGGMPANAFRAGVVDFVLPPEKMPAKLKEISNAIEKNGHTDVETRDKDIFEQIISLLCQRKKTDFTHYKQTTIRRRILRRIALNDKENPADYLKHLQGNNKELDTLYQDLLIPVTSFFRDPEIINTICKTCFPELVKNKDDKQPIRIWVAGCSTGQETYSIAICLKEFLGDEQVKAQIFATDINETAIKKARTGKYSQKEIEGLSPERVQRFFTKSNGHYHINKDLREMCVFAVHNFLKDPPFSKMDFVSCRNVLIYMDPYLQKKSMRAFHYALKPKGFLLLGKSEKSSSMPDLFTPVDKGQKLFASRNVPRKFKPEANKAPGNFPKPGMDSQDEKTSTDYLKAANDILLRKYTPASVIINDALEIVHFSGNTSNYLEQSHGKPTHNILKMAKAGLDFELQSIIYKARKQLADEQKNEPVRKKNIPVKIKNTVETIDLEAIPLQNTVEPYYLILFHKQEQQKIDQEAAGSQKKTATKEDNRDLRIKHLERELSQARDDLRNITEELEAYNEELQSTNEELQSSNEELQTLNEELETSKEEMESTNEELLIVNQELSELNNELNDAKKYNEAILDTIREPILVLDEQLRVNNANKSFYSKFKVSQAETVETLVYDLGDRQWDIPELRKLLDEVLSKGKDFSDYEVTRTFKAIGKRTMILNGRKILGTENLILLAIEDISEQAKSIKLIESERRFRQLAALMPAKIATLDPDGSITYCNQNWQDYTGFTEKKLKKTGCKKIMHPDELGEIKEHWQECLSSGSNFEMEHQCYNSTGEYQWHLTRATPIKDNNGKVIMWISVTIEIHKIKEEEQRKGNFIKMASHELKTPLTSIKGYVQLLMGLIDSEDEEQLNLTLRHSLGRVDKNMHRLVRMINGMLDISRLEEDRLELDKEQFNLSELVRETVDEIFYTDVKHSIDIQDDLTATVLADRDRISRVLINLINNAIKYSPDQDKIRVHIYEAENHQVAVSIVDYGIGIGKAEQEKIFDRFYRVSGNSEFTFTGFGIGLYVAREIINRHDGTISVESKKGKGSVFTFTLPMA